LNSLRERRRTVRDRVEREVVRVGGDIRVGEELTGKMDGGGDLV
jgi:hypothetical protein